MSFVDMDVLLHGARESMGAPVYYNSLPATTAKNGRWKCPLASQNPSPGPSVTFLQAHWAVIYSIQKVINLAAVRLIFTYSLWINAAFHVSHVKSVPVPALPRPPSALIKGGPVYSAVVLMLTKEGVPALGHPEHTSRVPAAWFTVASGPHVLPVLFYSILLPQLAPTSST